MTKEWYESLSEFEQDEDRRFIIRQREMLLEIEDAEISQEIEDAEYSQRYRDAQYWSQF